MIRRQHLLASLLVAITAAASSAQALELSDNMYLVATFGKSIKKHTPIQVDNDSAVKRGIPAGATNINISSTQTSSKNGYKLQLGYQLHENFAVEGGYVNLGDTEYNANYTYRTPTIQTGTASRTAKISGFNVALLGSHPINEDISVFAKAGGFYAQVKTDSSSAGAAPGLGNGDVNKTRWRGLMGVGANYRIDEDFGIRAEFERYNKLGDKASVGTIDINLMSVGLIGKF